MARGGAKFGAKKKLFDDRVATTKDGKKRDEKEVRAAQQRVEKLQSHINYKPRERYPVSSVTSRSRRQFSNFMQSPNITDLFPFSMYSFHSVDWGDKSVPQEWLHGAMKGRSKESYMSTWALRHHENDPTPQKRAPVIFKDPSKVQTEYNPQKGWLTPFKKISLPNPPPATIREQEIIDQWKSDKKKIREGDLFVRRVVDQGNTRVSKISTVQGLGGFGAVTTYSSKYDRRYRARPNLTGQLWMKQILPKELWEVVDPSLRKTKASVQTSTTRDPTHPAPKTRFNIADFSDDEGGAVDEDMDDSDAEREAEVEEVDVDFEDDESENDDYNAEQYFDDGERDDDMAADAEFGDDMGGGDEGHEREFDRNDEFDV